MASIVDAFNEALGEDKAIIKIVLYSIPVCFCETLFLSGKMGELYFYGSITAVLLIGLLTCGIHNVRMNKKEILTLNIVSLLKNIVKTAVVMIPQILLWGALGQFITTKVQIPIDLPHVPLIFSIIIWAIVFSVLLTAYLSFSKYLRIIQGYNYKVILESCIDILISFLFFIPQLFLANVVLIGPVAYLFYFFQLPFTHWGFVYYCSLALIVNISILANYLAQSAYEHIKGNNEEYDDHMQINVIDDASERLNGN